MEESQRQEAVVKIQAERSFLGHPRGIGVLSFRYMTNSFANYGMMAVLVYYLYAAVPGGLGLGKTDAAQLMSLFNALVILFSAVGSYMADRVFGMFCRLPTLSSRFRDSEFRVTRSRWGSCSLVA